MNPRLSCLSLPIEKILKDNSGTSKKDFTNQCFIISNYILFIYSYLYFFRIFVTLFGVL
jgi:hypothetical protein